MSIKHSHSVWPSSLSITYRYPPDLANSNRSISNAAALTTVTTELAGVTVLTTSRSEAEGQEEQTWSSSLGRVMNREAEIHVASAWVKHQQKRGGCNLSNSRETAVCF